MTIAVLAALLLTVAENPPTAAGTSPTTSTVAVIEPGAVEEAMRMLEADDFEKQVLTSTDVMVEGMLAVQMERLQKASDEPVPEDLLTSFREAMRAHSTETMKQKMPQIKRQAAEIYAREFTVAELRRLREISQDPVMVKSRLKSQTLTAQLMLVGVGAMRDSEAELERKIEQIVEDYVKKAGLLSDEKS